MNKVHRETEVNLEHQVKMGNQEIKARLVQLDVLVHQVLLVKLEKLVNREYLDCVETMALPGPDGSPGRPGPSGQAGSDGQPGSQGSPRTSRPARTQWTARTKRRTR